MKYLKSIPRKLKNGFREGLKAKAVKKRSSGQK